MLWKVRSATLISSPLFDGPEKCHEHVTEQPARTRFADEAPRRGDALLSRSEPGRPHDSQQFSISYYSGWPWRQSTVRWDKPGHSMLPICESHESTGRSPVPASLISLRRTRSPWPTSSPALSLPIWSRAGLKIVDRVAEAVNDAREKAEISAGQFVADAGPARRLRCPRWEKPLALSPLSNSSRWQENWNCVIT